MNCDEKICGRFPHILFPILSHQTSAKILSSVYHPLHLESIISWLANNPELPRHTASWSFCSTSVLLFCNKGMRFRRIFWNSLNIMFGAQINTPSCLCSVNSRIHIMRLLLMGSIPLCPKWICMIMDYDTLGPKASLVMFKKSNTEMNVLVLLCRWNFLWDSEYFC